MMTTFRTYCCNLCGDYLWPTDATPNQGFGVFFRGSEGLVFMQVPETEKHICHQCARSVHDEWRKVTSVKITPSVVGPFSSPTGGLGDEMRADLTRASEAFERGSPAR